MSGLTEDRWIVRPASAFNPLQYVVTIKIYEENSASNRNVIEKGRSILIAFLDNCGCS